MVVIMTFAKVLPSNEIPALVNHAVVVTFACDAKLNEVPIATTASMKTRAIAKMIIDRYLPARIFMRDG